MGFGGLADPQNWLERLEGVGMVLEARELLDAATLLEISGWLRQQFREEEAKFPLLAARAGALSDFKEALTIIRRSILPNGEISDDASPALRRIRASITQTRESIQKTLKHILRTKNAEAGEDYVTLRNDRFVIPLRAENRRSVPGVVHGASATGQTVFMEPLETVETNNQLVQLGEDEAAEIVRILRGLRKDCSGCGSRYCWRRKRLRNWTACLRARDLRRILMRRYRNFPRAANCGWKRRGIRCWKINCARKAARWCR